jgi:hypothetical protein
LFGGGGSVAAASGNTQLGGSSGFLGLGKIFKGGFLKGAAPWLLGAGLLFGGGGGGILKTVTKTISKVFKGIGKFVGGIFKGIGKIFGFHDPFADIGVTSAGQILGAQLSNSKPGATGTAAGMLGASFSKAGLPPPAMMGQAWGIDFGKLFTTGVSQGIATAKSPNASSRGSGGEVPVIVHQTNYINNPQDWERNAKDAFRTAKRLWEGGAY